MKIKRYSKLVCSAVDLGVSLDDLIFETKKYHGMEFGNRVETAVKAMIQHR
jgi:hypothetical protein